MTVKSYIAGYPHDQLTARRDFLIVLSAAFVATGAAAAVWPFIASMNPDLAASSDATIEVDLAPVALGQRITVRWRGRPVFIVRRTYEAIALVRADDRSRSLIEPAEDKSRVIKPEWLIVVGVCTHLGCIPLGQGMHDLRGQYGGWFCPCHGSLYDLSGRVRRGPAPRNLEVPPYHFVTEDRVLIGSTTA